MPSAEEVGKRLKDVRMDRGMTLKQVAEEHTSWMNTAT